MRFLCDKTRLEAAISPMLAAIPAKDPPKPALKNLFLEAVDDGLVLRASNMEISIESRMDSVKVSEPGQCLVPARQLYELLKEISDPTVSLERDGDTVVLPTSSGKFEIVSSNAEEYPELNFEADGAGIELPLDSLRELYAATEFACAKEATRYAMNGVLVRVADEKIHFVGTDGRRLALASMNLEEGKQAELEALIPNKSFHSAIRVIEGSKQDFVSVHFGESGVLFTLPDVRVSIQKIVGSFPDFDTVIPRGTSNVVEINRSLLEANLRRARILTDDLNPSVKISFEGSQAVVESQASGLGSGRSTMDVALEGPGGHIVFNPNYILEALKASKMDPVRFEFEDHCSPGKFTLGEQFLYVIMPITAT